MAKVNRQYRELADRDPATALLVLFFMLGILGVGLIFIGVFGGSCLFMWEVWVARLVMFLVLLLVEWGIWKTVTKTYGI